MRRLLLAFACVIALPLHAERVRVVVAVQKPEVSVQSVTSLRAGVLESLQTGSRIERWGTEGRAFSVEIDSSELERLRADTRVRAVSIDAGGEGALLESIPLIGADVAHAQGFDGRGVTVAVLDTGIDGKNPDFRGRIVTEQCFCDNLDGTGCCPGGGTEQSGEGAALDDNGHGTHVSGIVAGGGASAPGGVAPGASIVAVKVMDASNSFRGFTQIYRALEWILTSRPDVRVINMSLGSFALFGDSDCGANAVALGMEEVIGALRARGVLITASSGNQGDVAHTTLPACMDEVLAVGATYDMPGHFTAFCDVPNAVTDEVTCFTNSSPSLDIVAPGATIVASRRGGGSVAYAGTSMAAPHVAGAIALMLQASGGALTADQTVNILESTGRSVVDQRNGLVFPRLDVAAAIAATPRVPQPGRRRSVRR